jgi:hypothetical protein
VSGEQVTIEEIEAVLDRDVRPALSAHAGSIEVASSADGRVELRMTVPATSAAAASGSSSSRPWRTASAIDLRS